MSKEMKLSKQAMGSLMMLLQKCIMEQADIVPMLTELKLKDSEEGLMVLNPPLVKFSHEDIATISEAQVSKVVKE